MLAANAGHRCALEHPASLRDTFPFGWVIVMLNTVTDPAYASLRSRIEYLYLQGFKLRSIPRRVEKLEEEVRVWLQDHGVNVEHRARRRLLG